MKDLSRIQVTPNPVPQNTGITIVLPDEDRAAGFYQIENDEGKLIRRGKITERDRDLVLSTGGMRDGVYWLVVGGCRQRFTIL